MPSRGKSKLSRVRSAAGRAGAAARWHGVEREPTVKQRIFAADVERLKRHGPTIARAVRALLEGSNADKS